MRKTAGAHSLSLNKSTFLPPFSDLYIYPSSFPSPIRVFPQINPTITNPNFNFQQLQILQMAAGTLTSPMARSSSSLRFVPDTSLHLSGRSASNLSFSGRPSSATCVNASLHAVAEPAPVLEKTMRRPASLYEVLRVNRNASPTEIKSAYRTLAKVYHPDAASDDFKEDGRDFIEIHKAYATLSDPAARALYDMSLGRRPFGYSSAVGNRNGYYPTRRWETDQCW